MNYATFLSWVLSNLGEVKTLIDLAKPILDAPTVREKWEASKALGDKLLSLFESFPPITVAENEYTASSLAQMESDVESSAQAAGLPISIGDIYRLWTIIQPLIPILFGK